MKWPKRKPDRPPTDEPVSQPMTESEWIHGDLRATTTHDPDDHEEDF